MVTVRTLLTHAVVAKGWSLHQMDVNNSFLHGNLHKDIYIKPPPNFHSLHPNVVCELQNSLYVLR